jgi:hypothetical protein
MNGYETMGLVGLGLATPLLILNISLYTVWIKFAKAHRLVARSAFGLFAVCMATGVIFSSMGSHKHNGDYARKCHRAGGVVNEAKCFKPGSEIHI